MRLSIKYFLINVFFAGPVLFGEDNILLQYLNDCYNIDVYSFSPQILLKHSFSKFYKLPKNTILTVSKNKWDSKDSANPYLVVADTDVLLFYDGDNDSHFQIGHARLSDVGWYREKRGKILEAPDDKWESNHGIDPVVFLVNYKWFMWSSVNKSDCAFGYSLGTATSPDGKEWKKIQKRGSPGR